MDERTLAGTLAPYADQPIPISRDLEDLWDAHGLRMVSVPAADVPAILPKLQTEGSSERQWLGQAYVWTEAARGDDLSGSRIVALDAERIRLSPGMLRLLVRSWLEPVPPEPAVGAVTSATPPSAGPGAILKLEIVPQHREAQQPDAIVNPLGIAQPTIDAESQGLLFSRLFARMGLQQGRALIVLSARPGTNWKRLASAPKPAPADGKPEAASTRPSSSPRVGQVTRGEPPADGAPRVSQPVSDPLAGDQSLEDVRVPTLGEAMLSRPTVRSDGRTPGPPRRTILVLIPHVPKEFRLLAPAESNPPRRAEP